VDHDHPDTLDEAADELDSIEAYCVRCRETVIIEDPIPVWTSKGIPAMRGSCPSCGNPVFRMGRSAAHDLLNRPAPVKVDGGGRKQIPKETVYLNYAPDDEATAAQVAADLEKMGFACWLHQAQTDSDPNIHWAGGVHPSLRECSRMILLLSPAALNVDTVETAWKFFREKNKPVVIAQLSQADPPDALRRRPRFDLGGDYKGAFRQMLQALNE
jgi:hypothetical protein